MSGRDTILKAIRSSLGVSGTGEARAAAVRERLSNHPAGIIPARGQRDLAGRVALFCEIAEKVSASVEHVASADAVPEAVASYLRARNLPASVRMGDDERLQALPWHGQKALDVKRGASNGKDEAGVSFAFGAVAETGTVMLLSGHENPTTVNFLPEHHIVVVDQNDIAGDLETLWAKLRVEGKGEMPRVVNLVTGPSRSGDIEQTILLGAHGPRALHLIVVGS